jgi:hypothetical protein
LVLHGDAPDRNLAGNAQTVGGPRQRLDEIHAVAADDAMHLNEIEDVLTAAVLIAVAPQELRNRSDIEKCHRVAAH